MFQVLSAQIAHETNTFSLKRTRLEDYQSRALYFGDTIRSAFENTNTEIGAHLAAADLFGWEMVQPIACSATPSGPTEPSVWWMLRDKVFDAAISGKFDGAVIALHGAMVAEGEDDADGALLEGLRLRLGPDVPIIVTVDLHANVSDRMAKNCNGLLSFKTYPHVDQREVGFEACRLLRSAMESKKSCSVHVWRLPTLTGCDFGRTGGAVMQSLLQMSRQTREMDEHCEAMEICAGFPWSDVPFAGPSVVMTWSGAKPPPARLVKPLLHEIWATRNFSSVEYLTPGEATTLAKGWCGEQPLVIADSADNPGAGGYGDSVVLLKALLAAGVQGVALAAIADPEAAAKAVAAGPGANIPLKLGGIFEPHRYGGSLACKATVVSVSHGALKLSGPMMNGVELSLGPSAVLRIGTVLVVVVTNNTQVFDRSIFLSQGIDPLAQRVLVVKSSHHFRSDFGGIAGRIILVDAGGAVSPNVTRLNYRKLRRPIEPLEVSGWEGLPDDAAINSADQTTTDIQPSP